MPTSGSYNYSVTAAQIINQAMKDIRKLGAGQTINSNDESDCLRVLNFIAKQWQGTADMAQGLKIWTRQRVFLFLAKGQQTYTIGPASTDARATTQYGRTTISAAEAAGQTVLSITSNTDTTTFPGTTVTMTNGDIIGIELDDGTIQWTTISGTPASTATVAVALTGAAAAGNYVWWFTSRAQRLPVVDAARLRNENGVDTPLTVYTEAKEYDLGVADKYADGTPTALLVEPLTVNTRITLNSQPTDVTDQIVLTALYPAEDYDSTADDIAFPQEYFAALEWELALRICPMFGQQWDDTMQRAYMNAVPTARQLNPENSTAYFEVGGL